MSTGSCEEIATEIPVTGLSINVIRPANISADAKLPILVVSHTSHWACIEYKLTLSQVDIRWWVHAGIECLVSPCKGTQRNTTD